MSDENTPEQKNEFLRKTGIGAVLVALGFGLGYFTAGTSSDGISHFGQGSSKGSILQSLSKVVKPEPLPPQEKFVQVAAKQATNPKALQTAVSTYRANDDSDLTVSLVGAVHIADVNYFDAINKELGRYDVVLYELIGPKDAKPQIGAQASGNFLSSMQNTMSDLLDVTHQLGSINYARPNFVHADLSFDELIAEGKKRGETRLTLLGWCDS